MTSVVRRIGAYGRTAAHPSRRCRVGLHDWSSVTGPAPGRPDIIETWNRCERVGCKHDYWKLVDVRRRSKLL